MLKYQEHPSTVSGVSIIEIADSSKPYAYLLWQYGLNLKTAALKASGSEKTSLLSGLERLNSPALATAAGGVVRTCTSQGMPSKK